MPPPVLSKPIATALRLPLFPRLAGAIVAAMGAFVILAWHVHWTRAIQLLPNLPLMHYNTALCFVLCGSGLFLLTTSRARAVPWLGGAAAALAALTLLEYFSGHDFGIDQLFLKPYFDVTVYSGRMSPLAALSFILSGVALVLASSKDLRTTRLAGAGLLACVVLAIALVTLAGYAFQIESLYGWGAYLRMAVNSAVTFSIFSSGLILWSCRAAQQQNYSFLRWLPVTGAVTLMVMVGVISVVNMAQLRNATAWRRHTYEVIESAQTFQTDFIEMQRNVRGYVTMGTPELLTDFLQETNTWDARINHLMELTRDNPSQLPHLQIISGAMQNVMGYDDQIVDVYQRSGSQAVLRLDAGGQGRRSTGQMFDGLKAFSLEEKGLLNQRDAKEQSDYQCVENLLIFGSALSALLLIMANSMAGRELRFRHRAEAQLQETLALKNAILQSASYAVISVSTEGTVTTFNSTAERWLGYTAAEVVGRQTPLLWHEASEIENRTQAMSRELGRVIKPGFESLVARARLGQADEMESVFIRKDGSRFPVLLSVTPLKDSAGTATGFVGVIADITERKRAAQKIADSLREKESLLREIHHRVKNNMQVISSILQLQSGYIKDPTALDVFKDCQGRIRTMALIHEKLYRSEGMAQIDFKDYLESLVGLLLRSQAGRGVTIRHEFKIQPVNLEVDTAIPLGLIANELVSNCLKHAFAGRQRGFVQVILEQADGGGYRLGVKDDGIGLPAGFDPDKTTSLGVRLVKILGGQIHGRTEFKNNEGTEINVLFGGGEQLNKS